MDFLTIINIFFKHFLGILFSFSGLFLFTMMLVTGWAEHEKRPKASRLLFVGGGVLVFLWIWIKVSTLFI
jgi:hypothetical protein